MIYPVAMEYLSLEEKGEGMRDEEVLLASVHTPSLFALLVRKYEEPFLRKALSIVREQEAAEDVVQEAFTKIYLNAGKFKTVEGAQFSSWGYRILINTALTHYARRKRRSGGEVGLDEEIWALIPDRNLRQFEKKEVIDLVASVLSRMPAPMSRALSLFFIEGKTQEEIAEAEGLSVGAVKTRVHRAKKEFKKVFETISNKSSL
ncbi:sigma-70 family RNA polymerase sigma factor [Candidatus Kaiserbacteria bacterium]|nr:sigma-70 family RNA polymerase sigma factor [Candidatus Kaiserbacteria bacterium]